MAKRITMAELARAANVDTSTVSRALNDSSLVKEETKRHILNIASDLGYVIHASARNLRRQSSETIGLVIPLVPESGQTISDPFFLEMVGAVAHAASQEGYDLIVNVPSAEQQDGAEQRLLQTGRADGLIIIGQAGRTEFLNKLGKLAERVVVWGGSVPEANYTVVGSDNVRGGELAVEHLLNRGRERVLFVGDSALPEVQLRYEGLKKAHRVAGLEHDADLILPEGFGGKSTFTDLQRVLDSGLEFDAVFAASDVLAITAIHSLQAYGKHVPGDVSVVGYDNIGQASIMTPALTTIDQHIADGGRIMVELLLRKLAGTDVRSRTNSTELVVRDST
ncbi:MAG: substrate-binding domain-containing protein [Pseudomonadota bacterium]